MDRTLPHHIYKYAPTLDRFLRVRVVGAAGLGTDPLAGRADGRPLDAAAYRRLVVEQTVADLEPTLLAAEHPDAEELLLELFGLVLDVNPELDLPRVRLGAPRCAGRMDTATLERGHPGQRTETDSGSTAKSLRRRLRRISKQLEARLEERVVGQPQAVSAVARTLRRAALGWDQTGPLGTLLFLGPTGTGKTELAKALAGILGNGERLLRIDCSEFAAQHEVAKLIGAPPGYVGHGEGGFLPRGLERVERDGFVLLFDELEKAHERVHHLLLQILDEGFVTDGTGRQLSFENAFVILTSNTGTRELLRSGSGLGFSPNHAGGLADATRDEIAREALETRFPPEFLARLDERVTFRDMDLATARRIAEMRLLELAVRVRRGGQRVRFRASVAPWLGARGLEQGEGARGILHVLRRDIEAPLAALCIESGRGWIEGSIRAGKVRLAR